jgi:hypothetical protein
MPFTVTWDPSAQNNLALIWINATDRTAVTNAANFIDRRLRISPDSAGQDLSGFRMFTVPPLTVTFTVSPGDRLVTVRNVWRL